MTADLSVVICGYTEARWNELVAAVKSVQRQLKPPREIIIVIDHNPRLLERARAFFSGATVLGNQKPQGISGARNTAVLIAQGGIIAFLDDDAIATPDWLHQLSIGYSDPEVLGVGGMIEPLWPAGRPHWFPEEFNWVLGCTYRGLPEESASVRNLIGANMSFRREVFDHVRFYSGIGHIGGRPLGGADPDFGIRIKQQWPQKILLYRPDALVYHCLSKDRTRWKYFCVRCYNEGLSKSLLTRRVGPRQGLSSERRYALHTLPQGVLRGLADTVRGDASGLSRAVAIIVGLTITIAGYIAGLTIRRLTEIKPTRPQRNILNEESR